jgi:hypothetical protein
MCWLAAIKRPASFRTPIDNVRPAPTTQSRFFFFFLGLWFPRLSFPPSTTEISSATGGIHRMTVRKRELYRGDGFAERANDEQAWHPQG